MDKLKSILPSRSRKHRSYTEASTTTLTTDALVDEPPTVAPKTPLWDQAVCEFREKCKAEYQKLKFPASKDDYDERGLSKNGIEFKNSILNKILNKTLPEAFQEEVGHSKHEIIGRLKSWLPALGNAKALAMTLARLDPNQLAPYIIAGSFFAVEILLQTIPTGSQEATLDVLCDSIIIMLKWRSYEENISPGHRSIPNETAADAVQRLNRDLPNLYVTALKLQARIRGDTQSRKKFSVATLLGRVEAWKVDLNELKRKDRDCVATKDIIKDCLENQDRNSEILRWIQGETPDPHHKEIKKKTGMDRDAYRRAGRWFIQSECFESWMTPGTGQPTQKVVWLKGTMGTGKSTLMCQAISRFSEEEDQRPPGSLRVAYYYCSASSTRGNVVMPKKEIVLRSLCRKLAWQPNGTIAKCASDDYDDYKKFAKPGAESPDWEDLLHRLIDASANPVILVIDALDECSKEEELLKCLAESVRSRSNLYILCSSRPHVQVATYFDAAPAEINTMSGKKEPDMGVFIKTTVEERMKSPVTQKSIFCGPHGTTLVDDLKQALEKGADGMFRWVEIWLSIIFPPNPKTQITGSDDARDQINKIAKSESDYLDSGHAEFAQSQSADLDRTHTKFTVAYKQLWKANSMVRNKVLQPRLFHLVLCAFDDLTLNQLTEALRIDPEDPKKYQEDLKPEQVEWLCHNFLVTNSTAGLEWAHQSAKDFVTHHMMEANTPVFSEASNHICMSKIALQLLSQIDHPAWNGLNLPYWQESQSSGRQAARLELDFERIAKPIHEVNERDRTECDPDETKDIQFDSETFMSREQIKILALVLKAASFASYVVARFVYHLRCICDATASMCGLEELMRTVIVSRKSALPAVAKLFQTFSSLNERLKWKGLNYNEGREVCWPAESFTMYSQLVRKVPMARKHRTPCEIMRTVCRDHDGEALVAPLQLLTLINTPDKALFQHAVDLSKLKLKTDDWNNYPAELTFLACKWNSDNVVALLLSHALFPESRYPTSRELLQAKNEDSSLPIHVAAFNGYSKVIEELLRAEERDVRSLSKESHASEGDKIASDDDHPKLLYVPDGNGDLPVHLAAEWNAPQDGDPIFELMIGYDAKYATLFPATLSHQPGTPDSTGKQTSMLLTENYFKYLPIHLAAANSHAPALKSMLQREYDAFREYTSTQLPSSSSQNHQQRSDLLFARTPSDDLPIHIVLSSGFWRSSPKTHWTIVQTMLLSEAKWMDLTTLEKPSRKRRSELLDSKVFEKMIWHWERGDLKPEWLDWLLDSYEVHSSFAVTTWLAETRLRKKDDYQVRRLEQLSFEPDYDVEAASMEFFADPWYGWH